ncbi:MAG: helix-turn-helix domain-containing protein [Bacteroidota bacterium]
MQKEIPVHTLKENAERSCMVRRLNAFDGTFDTEEAHRHNYYEILLFDKGGGQNMIDFELHEVHSTSLHFVSPGQVHALSRTKNTDGYLVVFTKDFMLLNGGNTVVLNDFPAFNKVVSPVLEASSAAFADVFNLVIQMENESKQDTPLKESILAAYINLLLIKCKALLIETPDYKKNDETAQQLIQRFNTLLEVHFIEFHKVNEYADLLSITPNHLSDSIKKITGKTAGELIHQRIILEAKRLLLYSDSTAKEIAYILKFNDPSYFSRFFKANTGYSPENFRKEVRKTYQI